MKRRILGVSMLAAAMLLTAPTAFGFGKRKNDCPPAPCGSPCGGAAYGVGGPCGHTVSYVEQKVTAFKTEWETKDVKVMVTEWVPTKEEYKYFVMEPEMKKEKVKVKEMQNVEQKFKYMATEWVTVKEKVKVADWKQVEKEVEVVSFDFQPVVTKQKRVVCEWVCVPVQVSCVVQPQCNDGRRSGGLFGNLCRKKRQDDCCASPCGDPCAPPCPQVVTRTVMQRQMMTREIEFDCTTYNRIEKKEMKKVMVNERIWVEKEVEVRQPTQVEKEGTRMVCVWVDVEKEVEVRTFNRVEKVGERQVMKPTQVEKTVQQRFAKQVPYETTVRVPVYTPVASPCVTPCPSPCQPVGMSGDCCGSSRGGLFAGRSRGGLFSGRTGGGCCGK